MSRLTLSFWVSLLLAVFLIAMAACADDDPAGELPPLAQVRTCLTRDPGELERAAVQAELHARPGSRPFPGKVIDVHVHVIRRSSRTGNVKDAQIIDQIAVLDQAYAGTGFAFRLASIDRTINPDWYGMTVRSDAERRAKHALRIGGQADLNLYTAEPTGGILGWATFPWDWQEERELDGVVVHVGTLPGGDLVPFAEGDTAVHEVGHWLGLYHTFQGGCSESGDHVDDTPAEAGPGFDCPLHQDSCPGQPGQDPPWDFMDYSDDACMDRFTPGQARRMQEVWAAYRN